MGWLTGTKSSGAKRFTLAKLFLRLQVGLADQAGGYRSHLLAVRDVKCDGRPPRFRVTAVRLAVGHQARL